MNEIREELERQFKERGLRDDASETDVVCDTANAQTPDGAVNVVVCYKAPSGYLPEFAEDFRNLPPVWQKFLSEHEAQKASEISEYTEKLDGYRWIDDIFSANEQRLAENGISKVRDWLEGLAWIDAEMSARPAETLKALAVIYGVNPQDAPIKDADVSQQMIARLCQLERGYHDLTAYLEKQQTQKFMKEITAFSRQTDEKGRPLHPYLEDVMPEIFNLLESGVAQDIASAYEKALWLVPHIRGELITQKINSKAVEAQKAQKAAFSPKGKSEAPKRELTLREELEKNLAAFKR